MAADFDDWIENLQQEIDRDVRNTYSEEVFTRWKNPTHIGRMDRPDSMARVKGSCGDTMEIYLRIQDGRIVKACAYTDGCGSSMVCGSMIAEMAEGKDLDEAMSTRSEDVIKALGGLPEEDLHCAALAAGTLREAIHLYMKTISKK